MMVDLSSIRKGKIGELAVIKDLCGDRYGYDVYVPVVDDNQVDLIVETKLGRFDKVNVKHVIKLKSKTSMELRVRQHHIKKRVDVMAVYYEPIGIAYIPFRDMKYPKSINLALFTAVNNQDKRRKYFYQYMRYPEFE